MTITLYSYYRSSASYRVRIALNIKQIPYRMEAIDLTKNKQRDSHFLEKNQSGLVPALKLDNGVIITQSTAILEWLEQTYTTSPLIHGHSTIEQSKIREIANIIACDIHPLNNLRVLKYLSDKLDISDEKKMEWYHHWVHQGFSAIEKHLISAPYAVGDDITLADVYLVPQVYNAMRFNIDLSPYPKIINSYKACNLLKPFISAHPDQQADNPHN